MSDVPSDSIYDVVVVGGGPSGLSCALYASRAKLSTIVLDKGAGSSALAWAEKIVNFPGVKGPLPGATVLETIRAQALEFGAEYRKATVSAADVASDIKTVYTSEDALRCRVLVVASGSRGRHKTSPGEQEFLGRGVSYCATCDAAFYGDKTVGVAGEDDFSVEEALLLARFAHQVHLIAPSARLSASAAMVDTLSQAPNVELHTALHVREIQGEDMVTGVLVEDDSGSAFTIPLDGLFILLSGGAPATDYLAGAVELDETGCIRVDGAFATNVPGVYAVGDVTCPHPNQAVIAAAEGVIAALAIDKYLTGAKAVKPQYGHPGP